jgi:hypothetical protein
LGLSKAILSDFSSPLLRGTEKQNLVIAGNDEYRKPQHRNVKTRWYESERPKPTLLVRFELIPAFNLVPKIVSCLKVDRILLGEDALGDNVERWLVILHPRISGFKSSVLVYRLLHRLPPGADRKDTTRSSSVWP